MDMNCKIHDFCGHHPRVYRCKQCGLLELTDYFLGDLKAKHYGSFIDGASYVWHPEIMQASQIEKFAIGFGDRPIVNILFSGNQLIIHNTINGSRDGWMSFPEGFFDEKSRELNNEQIQSIRACLEALHFEQWHTPQYVFRNAGACGFCINAYFRCTFPDGKEFVCEEPKSPDFGKLVSLMKELIR